MQNLKNYFDILGIKPGTPPEEIKNAHKALMEYWNPDRVPDFYRQKAMEGRDKIDEAYQVLMGLKKTEENKTEKQIQMPSERIKPQQSDLNDERVLLGKDQDEALFYLDKKTITVNKNKVEVEVDIYPPEGSHRLHMAQGYVRRAGLDGLECLVEKWGFVLLSGVFIKHSLHYKSICGQLVQATGDFRKVWRPILPGTLEETAWIIIDNVFHEKNKFNLYHKEPIDTWIQH